jgi:hypothetical protein
MKNALKVFVASIIGWALALGAIAYAQSGMVRLTNFGAQTNLTGIGSPCVTSCYVTLSQGTVVLNGATPVTVANALMTANSVVLFTLKTVGGTVSPNAPNVLTTTPGTGFTVGGTASDTSTYNYVILN